MPHAVTTALIGLFASLLAWKVPQLGDQATQQYAQAFVTGLAFVIAWMRPPPTAPSPPVAAPAPGKPKPPEGD